MAPDFSANLATDNLWLICPQSSPSRVLSPIWGETDAFGGPRSHEILPMMQDN